MNSKINNNNIERYSETLASKLCDNYFINESFVTGPVIVQFTPIPQINYFVLENIFGNWIEETSNLESPYFDYENEKVQSALRTFMNSLSHHIKIDRDHFEPLLINAIKDTINLVLSPFTFFKTEYFPQERVKITMEELQELSKYIKINKLLISDLVEKFQKVGTQEILIDELVSSLSETYNTYKEELVPAHDFIEELNALHPVRLNDFSQQDSESRESNNTKVTEKKILYDSLKSDNKNPTLVDSHSKSSLDSIESGISVNQKYTFVKILFAGNSQKYEEAITELETCESLSNANLLLDSFAQKYDWNPDKNEVQELFEIVGRKYETE